MLNFDYTITTSLDVETASQRVKEAIAKAGFRVLTVHDVQKTLHEKGLTIEPLKIIEFCNAKSAYAVLQADIKTSLCLPCKINVYIKDGKTFISGMRPIVLNHFFPEADLGTLPREIDTAIKNIIDQSK
ncbi:DUF302 domain-containing protein [Candidatus Peregrinibacteria bacterium]|nr:DUF302 domain-containing protein [Candidatus Peregrinibacteria bacterium]